MNKASRRLGLDVCLSLVLLAGLPLVNAQEQTNIVPRADAVLRGACDFLAQIPQFTLQAELWRERVTESGQKLQFTRLMEWHVKRPNRFRAEIRAPLSDRGFWYDGKVLSVLDRKHNVFSTVPMPATLDAALDSAHEKFGVDLPLTDLAVSDPYKSATARVQQGRYFGLASVLGVECHHLAFTQDNIDWQLWIENGPRPFFRKLVITHKNDEGSPEFTALLTAWNVTEPIANSDFVFLPPLGASKVEMRPDDAMPTSTESPHAAPAADPAH